MSGEEIRGEFSSADATTAAAPTWYKPNGAAYTLDAGDRIVITDIIGVCAVAAGVVKIFSDNDADGAVDAGELLAPVSGLSVCIPGVEIPAAKGKAVKVKAAVAGQIDLVILAKICRV